jgi:hypothetical protein
VSAVVGIGVGAFSILAVVAIFVLGAIATHIVTSTYQHGQRRLFSRLQEWCVQRSIGMSALDQIVPVVMTRLTDVNDQHNTYVPQTVQGTSMSPLRVGKEYLRFTPIDLEGDDIIEIHQPQRVDFEVNEKLVRQALRQGRRFTNSPVLYITGAQADPLILQAGTTGYRGVVTLADRVFTSMRRNTKRTSTFVTALGTSLEAALSSPDLTPLNFGSDATCAFWDGKQYVTPIHRRSKHTINAPGAITLTPSYTYETNVSDDVRSRFGVVGYNFLREFLEEFWGEQDLSKTAEQSRADPDFMFDRDHGRRLLDEVDNGRVELWSTGVAIDLTHVCCSVALAARFTSPEFLAFVRRAPGHIEATAGDIAEMEGPSDKRPVIAFPALFGPSVEALLVDDDIKPTSLFSLDRARLLFQKLPAPAP